MKIDYTEINPSLSINKQQIRNAISPETFKLDTEGFHSVIRPLIPVNVAKNLILQNTRLDKCIRIIAQDVILNEFTFLSETTNDDDQHDKVLNFWKNNVDELNKQEYEVTKKIEEMKKSFEVTKAKMEALLIAQLEMLQDDRKNEGQ